MDLLRTLVMLGAMSAFLGICWWAYAPSRKEHWERKAWLDKDDA